MGGFANRWLYFFGVPKDPKPNPPKVQSNKRDELVKVINDIRLWSESVPNGEVLISDEAKILIEQWRREYNQVRSHSSSGHRPPAPETKTPVELTL